MRTLCGTWSLFAPRERRRQPFVNSRLARMIHDGSSRNRRVTWRDRRAEPGRTRSVLVQYVEGPRASPLAEGSS